MVDDQCLELALREETEADVPFLTDLFLSVRGAMFDAAGLPKEAIRALLVSQAAIQRKAYRANYPDADFLVIVQEERPVGRLYLSRTAGDLRVVDISLLPEMRGRGHGAALLRGVQRAAAAEGRTVSLQVDPLSPARRLYCRLDFRETGPEGAALGMTWRS